MRLLFLFIVLMISCTRPEKNDRSQNVGSENGMILKSSSESFREALLASRIESLEVLNSIVKIEYIDNKCAEGSTDCQGNGVIITQRTNGKELISVLNDDISQKDIIKARDGGFIDKLQLLINSPFAVSKRMELTDIYVLARWRYDLYGWGDVAFFDLAEAATNKINTPDLAFLNARDSSEKGYLNTFNHVTAQAIITTLYSEEIADFIADVHERYNMPELISGKFSQSQLSDFNNNPVDNYVDMINNEWGQELGKELRDKYNITKNTKWNPSLLANYLNDLQSYYSWVFQIGMKPFTAEEKIVVRFSEKINSIMLKNRYQ